jgi:hypothetical protein
VTRRPATALAITAVVLTLGGCSPPQSGLTGLLVKDGAVHVVAHSCPGWFTSTFDPDSAEITTISWEVVDAAGLPLMRPHDGSHAVRSEPDVAIGTAGSAQVTLGSRLVEDPSHVIVTRAARQDDGGVNEFFTRSLSASPGELMALRPGEVLIPGHVPGAPNHVVTTGDFAAAACAD